MASTPSSSTDGYTTVAEFLKRYDKRTVAQLASDTGVKLQPGQVATNERVLTALKGASGMLEASCTSGGTYTPEDLAALTGASAAFRDDIISDLAMGRLFLARPDREGQPPKAYELAMEILDQLRAGTKVLGLVQQRQAQTLTHTVETPQVVENRAGIVYTARPFFGTRRDRMYRT